MLQNMKNTNDLYSRLVNLSQSGSKQHRKISKYLIWVLTNLKEINFSTIDSLSSLTMISRSTIARFATSNGWPSYKHFYFEFVEFFNTQLLQGCDVEKSYLDRSTEIAKLLASKEIVFICSKKSKFVGDLINSRLIEYGIKSECFQGGFYEIGDYVGKIWKSKLIVLITISGGSMLVSQAIEEIAKRYQNGMHPNILIISSAKWLNIFEKYSFIKHVFVKNEQDIDTSSGYNYSISSIVDLLLRVVNELYDLEGRK